VFSPLIISLCCILSIITLCYKPKIVGKPLQAGQAGRIDSLMNAVYQHGQFTGAVLIASHDKIIYEKAFGFADRQRQRPFTPDTLQCWLFTVWSRWIPFRRKASQRLAELLLGNSGVG